MIACEAVARKGVAGLGIEAADFRENIHQPEFVLAGEAPQRGKVAPGKQVQIVEDGAHHRVEPVAAFELQRQAFAQGTGEETGGMGLALQRPPHP